MTAQKQIRKDLQYGTKERTICLLDVAVGKLEAVREDALDFLTLLDLDLALGNHLGSANVEVVASTIAEVLDEETGRISVELEADLLETLERWSIELGHLLGRLDVELLDEWYWKRGEHDIGVID